MKPGCPERRLDRVTEGDHARFLTPKHTLCILYPESLPAEACNSALESRGSLIRSHSGPRSLSRKIRRRGRPGGASGRCPWGNSPQARRLWHRNSIKATGLSGDSVRL